MGVGAWQVHQDIALEKNVNGEITQSCVAALMSVQDYFHTVHSSAYLKSVFGCVRV